MLSTKSSFFLGTGSTLATRAFLTSLYTVLSLLHSLELCPFLWHLKHKPPSIYSFLSSLESLNLLRLGQFGSFDVEADKEEGFFLGLDFFSSFRGCWRSLSVSMTALMKLSQSRGTCPARVVVISFFSPVQATAHHWAGLFHPAFWQVSLTLSRKSLALVTWMSFPIVRMNSTLSTCWWSWNQVSKWALNRTQSFAQLGGWCWSMLLRAVSFQNSASPLTSWRVNWICSSSVMLGVRAK